MIKDLVSALRFLTILPVGKSDEPPRPRVVPFFPLAGLGIGAILALVDSALQEIFSLYIVSLIDVLLLAVISGALHLDGLADTADGLFSHQGREAALQIMKDSRIGTMGLLALVFVLSIKWAGLSSLNQDRALCLLIIPAYARGAFSIAICFLDYLRPEGGTAKPFFSAKGGKQGLIWLLAPAALALLLGLRGLFLTLAFIGIVALVTLFYKKKMGGVTGDMLGALGEVTEALLFLCAAA
jgi:adenosylcobinamide-GDP ribazoletransferase